MTTPKPETAEDRIRKILAGLESTPTPAPVSETAEDRLRKKLAELEAVAAPEPAQERPVADIPTAEPPVPVPPPPPSDIPGGADIRFRTPREREGFARKPLEVLDVGTQLLDPIPELGGRAVDFLGTDPSGLAVMLQLLGGDTNFAPNLRAFEGAEFGSDLSAQFRERPLPQQFGLGALFDPLNAVPGLGFVGKSRLAGRGANTFLQTDIGGPVLRFLTGGRLGQQLPEELLTNARRLPPVSMVPAPSARVSFTPPLARGPVRGLRAGVSPSVEPVSPPPPSIAPVAEPNSVVERIRAAMQSQPPAEVVESPRIGTEQVGVGEEPLQGLFNQSGFTPPLARGPRSGLRAGEPPVSLPEVTEGPLAPFFRRFREVLNDPERALDWEMAKLPRRTERGFRIGRYSERMEELIRQGASVEEADIIARSSFAGTLPTTETTVFDEFKTPYIREALFQEVYSKTSGYETTSTIAALKEALRGGIVPRDVGSQGGSAFTRLQRVFGEELTETLGQGLKLEDVVEAETRAGLGLTRFQGGARGDPGPVGDVLQLPQPVTERMALGERLPPFSGIELLTVGEDARRSFLAAGRPRATGPSQVIDAPGTQGALNPPETQLIPDPPIEPFPQRVAETRAEEIAKRIPLEQMNRTERLAVDARRLQHAADPVSPQGIDAPGTQGALNSPDVPLIPESPIAPFPDRPRPPLGLDTKTAGAMIRWAKLIGVNTLDLGNLIRSHLASVDMSFLRQQKKFLFSHPVELAKSFKQFFKSAWTQEYADNLTRQIANDPDMPMLSVDGFARQEQLYKKLKLTFLRGTIREGSPRAQREESLYILGERASKTRPFVWLAQHSPWINISGRAFVGGIDAMNWGMWKGHLRSLFKIQEGIANGTITRSSGIKGQFAPGTVPLGWDLEKEALAFGHMLEEMTGRARLGPLQELSPALAQGFFSIRQRLGLLLSPRHLFNPSRATRVEAWKNFMSAIAAHSAIVLGGRQLGLWDVETDPRSSDYMKIKLLGGRIRIDVWGGNQQYLVLYARLLSGLTPDPIQGLLGLDPGSRGAFKSTKTGKVGGIDPLQTLMDFARSAQAPGVSTAVAAGFGKDYGGRDVDRGDWRFWLQSNIPLALEDIREAYEAEGLLEAGIVAPLGFIGEGIQAHELSEQDVALQLYDGRDYDDLLSSQRTRVRTRLKQLRSSREREKVATKAEETKARSKEREAERRQNFLQQEIGAPGTQSNPIQLPVPGP